MLNELIQAAKAIEEQNITVRTYHPALMTLPNYLAYKVFIATNGALADVQPWPHDISNLRKWKLGENGYSFPVFNIKPLHAPTLDQALVDEIRKWQTRGTSDKAWPEVFVDIERACDNTRDTWMDERNPTQMVRVYRKSLDDGPRLLAKTMSDFDMRHDALTALTDRLTKCTTPLAFFGNLDRLIRGKLRNGFDADMLKVFCALSEGDAIQGMNILLDLPDWNEIAEYPVVHGSTGDFLNELLHLTDGERQDREDCIALDAYGRSSKGSTEKYPEVKVPGLGPIKLRTMFEEAECQKRYGRIDWQSFIAGQDSRVRATAALEWLKQPGHKGKTWQWFKPTLILLYPETPLQELIDADIADFCSLPGGDDEAATSEADFLARAERVALAFQGKPRISGVPIHLFVLRKASKGQTKLVSHHFFTAKHLIEAATRWAKDAEDCPPISFARWGAEKGKRDDIVHTVPFPGEVVNWLNTLWVRNGEEQRRVSKKPESCPFALEDALTLLLANDGTERPMAERAIRDAIVNWSGFLARHGSNQSRLANAPSPGHLILKAKDAQANALRCLPAILSLLLHKLGHTKEQTMNSPTFLVGRLLALADALHFQYCLGVRNGSTPPQLMGNALMQTALETPQVALALYAQRILPYQAWAKTCTVPKEDLSPEKLAKSLLGQLANACEEAALSEIPERANDAAKAQMILGYLAKTKSND
jgi:hypothetical protein